MICPKCKGEFREGFTHCEKCGVDLEPDIPMEDKEVDEKVSVASVFKFLDFHVENWLKKGALFYVAINILYDISRMIKDVIVLQQTGPNHSFQILSFIFGLLLPLINHSMFGLFYYGLGEIISLLKKGLQNEEY